MHQHLGRVILCRQRGLVNGVDPLSVGLFHGQRVLGGFEQRLEILFRCRNGCQFRHRAAVNQMVGELLRMHVLLCRLFREVCGKAFQVQIGAPQ